MAEHLVYTERVGGSSPSPPTSQGRAKALFGPAGAFALVAVAFMPAVAQERGTPMSFHVAPLESRECGKHCPDVIVADGVIEAETPQAFVDFLKSGSADTKLRRIVFFNSRGGNVVASMVFGHILRGLRIAGVVGRFDAGGDPGPYVGECLSACVYALMGAVRRIAPPAARLGFIGCRSLRPKGVALAAAAGDAQLCGSADGRRAWPLRAANGRRSSHRPHRRVAAARHRACALARRNAALVIGDEPILGRGGRTRDDLVDEPKARVS